MMAFHGRRRKLRRSEVTRIRRSPASKALRRLISPMSRPLAAFHPGKDQFRLVMQSYPQASESNADYDHTV